MPASPYLVVVLALAVVSLQAAADERSPAGIHLQSEVLDSGLADGRLDVEGPAEPGEEGIADAARHEVVAAALERFSATDLSGRRWTAADLCGRVVLLDFWATWCAPCLADLPLLQALRQKHARADFEILGISLDVTSRRAFVSWLNRHRIGWPQIHERRGYSAEVPSLFGVEQLPSTVVVGRDGRAVAIDVRGDRLVAVVDALVAAGGQLDPGGSAPPASADASARLAEAPSARRRPDLPSHPGSPHGALAGEARRP